MKKDRREQDRQRREAMEVLRALLTRVRGLCRTLETLDRWYEVIAEVRRVFQDWADALPQRAHQRLEQALKKAEQVRGKLSLACKSLQSDLQGVIQAASAPAPAFPLKGVVIGVAATAVVGAGIATAVVLRPLWEERVSISVQNQCPDPLRYAAPGMEPPSGEIAPFSTQSVVVPAVKVAVQRSNGHVAVSFLGRGFRFSAAPGVTVSFNGQPISPGFEGHFDLSERSKPELRVLCP